MHRRCTGDASGFQKSLNSNSSSSLAICVNHPFPFLFTNWQIAESSSTVHATSNTAMGSSCCIRASASTSASTFHPPPWVKDAMKSKLALGCRENLALFAYDQDRMNMSILMCYALSENFVNALIGSCWNQKYALGYASAAISYALSNMVAIVMAIPIRRERVWKRSLVGKATLVGTIIWVGGTAMHDESVPEISMKSSLLFGVIVLGFILLRARPSQLRNSRRAIAFIMVLLLFMMKAVACRAANANSGDVPIGDKLPPDCQHVESCGLCLQCYKAGRGFYICCD